jgi:hypothetical protein
MSESMTLLSQSSEEYTSLNSKFLTNQKHHTTSLQSSLHSLETDLTSTFQRYQEEQETQLSKQEMELTEHSNLIQNTLQTLLSTLLTSNKSSQQQTREVMNSMVTSLTQRTQQTLRNCSNEIQNLERDGEDTSAEMQHIVATAVTRTNNSLEKNLNLSKEMNGTVNEIFDSAGDKRAQLDSTLQEVSAEISASVATGNSLHFLSSLY